VEGSGRGLTEDGNRARPDYNSTTWPLLDNGHLPCAVFNLLHAPEVILLPAGLKARYAPDVTLFTTLNSISTVYRQTKSMALSTHATYTD
jgi:hypothetical protein